MSSPFNYETTIYYAPDPLVKDGAFMRFIRKTGVQGHFAQMFDIPFLNMNSSEIFLCLSTGKNPNGMPTQLIGFLGGEILITQNDESFIDFKSKCGQISAYYYVGGKNMTSTIFTRLPLQIDGLLFRSDHGDTREYVVYLSSIENVETMIQKDLLITTPSVNKNDRVLLEFLTRNGLNKPTLKAEASRLPSEFIDLTSELSDQEDEQQKTNFVQPGSSTKGTSSQQKTIEKGISSKQKKRKLVQSSSSSSSEEGTLSSPPTTTTTTTTTTTRQRENNGENTGYPSFAIHWMSNKYEAEYVSGYRDTDSTGILFRCLSKYMFGVENAHIETQLISIVVDYVKFQQDEGGFGSGEPLNGEYTAETLPIGHGKILDAISDIFNIPLVYSIPGEPLDIRTKRNKAIMGKYTEGTLDPLFTGTQNSIPVVYMKKNQGPFYAHNTERFFGTLLNEDDYIDDKDTVEKRREYSNYTVFQDDNGRNIRDMVVSFYSLQIE